MWARDKWADKILADTCPFGVGLTGWGVEHREPVRVNKAHLDPRVMTVAGTPADEPEALITIPLIARDSIKGALNIYRLGDDASFDDNDFELAKRFGDAAALALDNAQVRARLRSIQLAETSAEVVGQCSGDRLLADGLAQAVNVLLADNRLERIAESTVPGAGQGDLIVNGGERVLATVFETARQVAIAVRLEGPVALHLPE